MQETAPSISVQSELEALRCFAQQIARLTADGEVRAGHAEAFVMENDDAVETLNGLIGEARALAAYVDPRRFEVVTFDERPGRGWEIINAFPSFEDAQSYTAVCHRGGPYILDRATKQYFLRDGSPVAEPGPAK